MSYIPMIIAVCIGMSIANIITYFIKRLMNSWKKLSKLDCVKKYGLGHKIGHILGVNMLSRCFMVIGEDNYNDREAVKHYLLKGYTVEEIASMTPMTLNEVSSHARYWVGDYS